MFSGLVRQRRPRAAKPGGTVMKVKANLKAGGVLIGD
jgi:hypothetical protein